MEHDLLFKELLTTFFFEFLDLFFPDLARGIDRTFGFMPMSQEIIVDASLGEHREVDLLMRVKLRGQETDFLVHVENQATAQSGFPERMFRYFAHLTLHHSLPVYPIVLFSHDKPLRAEPSHYEVTFLDGPVLRFDYRVVQLNRLSWRDYLRHDNPVATALMAKMKIAREDRPPAKVELLRILASKKYDPARSSVIGVFIERYLQLSVAEEQQFRRIMAQLPQKEQEKAMELMTSWGRAGLEQGLREGRQAGLHEGRQAGLHEGRQEGLHEGRQEGLHEGRQEGLHEGKEAIVLRLLRKRLVSVPDDTVARLARLTTAELDDLAEAVLDFTSSAELEQWLGRPS